MSRFRRPAPTSPDDTKLVEMATSLGQQLEIPKLDIRQVQWMDWMNWRNWTVRVEGYERHVPSDGCLLQGQDIVLPERMMGKLSLEEWRPLIASSILYEKRLALSLRGRKLLILPLVFVVVIGTLVASIILQVPNPWKVIFSLILATPVLMLMGRFYSRYEKKARLEADTKASVLTGKKSFLDVLKKIHSMGLDDVERPKTRGVLPSWNLPSITERIENLQGFSDIVIHAGMFGYRQK